MEKITLTAMRVSDQRIDYDFAVSPELKKYFKKCHLFYRYGRSIGSVPCNLLGCMELIRYLYRPATAHF